MALEGQVLAIVLLQRVGARWWRTRSRPCLVHGVTNFQNHCVLNFCGFFPLSRQKLKTVSLSLSVCWSSVSLAGAHVVNGVQLDLQFATGGAELQTSALCSAPSTRWPRPNTGPSCQSDLQLKFDLIHKITIQFLRTYLSQFRFLTQLRAGGNGRFMEFQQILEASFSLNIESCNQELLF